LTPLPRRPQRGRCAGALLRFSVRRPTSSQSRGGGAAQSPSCRGSISEGEYPEPARSQSSLPSTSASREAGMVGTAPLDGFTGRLRAGNGRLVIRPTHREPWAVQRSGASAALSISRRRQPSHDLRQRHRLPVVTDQGPQISDTHWLGELALARSLKTPEAAAPTRHGSAHSEHRASACRRSRSRDTAPAPSSWRPVHPQARAHRIARGHQRIRARSHEDQ